MKKRRMTSRWSNGHRKILKLRNVHCRLAWKCGSNLVLITFVKKAVSNNRRLFEDAKLPKEAYQNNPRAGGSLGEGGTSIPDVGETLDAVSAGVPRCWGAFTPSMRLVSIIRGRGWSFFRF